MVESPFAVRRGAAALALFCAAVVLAGCDAATQSIAESMSESEHRAEYARLEAQGTPQFSDPGLQGLVREFEAEYARYGLDGEKLKAGVSGPCSIAPKQAYGLLVGGDPELLEQAYAKAGIAMTHIVDYDTVTLTAVSGRCGAAGVEGAGEIVGSYRSITQLKSAQLDQVTVTDKVVRLRGSWQGGERRGPFRIIDISRSATFQPTAEGELKEQVSDWAYLNEMRDAPTAVWTYASFGPGSETEPVVAFMRNPTVGLFNTEVTERHADGRGYHRVWVGKELRFEGPTKNGVRHGWQVSHPYSFTGTDIPGRRDCYQNGEIVLATSCPE